MHRISRRILTLVAIICLVVVGQSSPLLRSHTALADPPVYMLYGSAPDAPDSELQGIVEDELKDAPGNWGVIVKKLDTGQFAALNPDKQQVSASLYKLWVLEELYRQVEAGIISLDDTATVTSDDAAYDASMGQLEFDVGSQLTLEEAAVYMIHVSDNTAAALLVRTLGTDNITRFMQQNGLDQSVLNLSGDGDNLTTPRDVQHELEAIATSRMVDAEASKDMVDLMLGQEINNLLPPGLPDGTPFAHKTGALDYLLHDAGIVYSPAGPYIIIAMSSNLDDYGTAWTRMPELSKRVYDYFNSGPTDPVRYFPETRQSVGHDFLKFWNTYGGLAEFGFPLGPEQVENGVLVQRFERARFEWHPDSAGVGGPEPQLVLGALGSERAAQLGLSWKPGPDPGAGQYFSDTGQAVSGEFLNYWENNGGARVFGSPISPAQIMASPADGKSYMTQWFQRARMEIHPDLPPGSRVVLASLGAELQASK